MLEERITISFVGTAQLKSQLERWAAQDDRSVSYVLRKILESEARRRDFDEGWDRYNEERTLNRK